MRNDPKRRSNRSFAAGLLSVLAIVAAVSIASRSEGPAAVVSEGGYVLPENAKMPYDGGIPSCVAGGLGPFKTADEIAENLQGTQYMPDHPLANTSNIAEAWMCTSTSVEILFDSGVEMSLGPTEHPNYVDLWNGDVAREPAHYRRTQIRGYEGNVFRSRGSESDRGGSVAWIIKDQVPVQADPAGGIPEATRQDLLIVIGDETHSVDDLEAVAQTVTPYSG